MLNGCGTFPLVKMRNKWRELRFGPSPGLWYTLMMQMLFDVFVWVQRLTNFYVCLVFFCLFFFNVWNHYMDFVFKAPLSVM